MRITFGSGLALLHEKRTEVMLLRDVTDSLNLISVNTNDFLVLDDDYLTAIFFDELGLMIEIVSKFFR